jgi:RNA polymerase sigma-70 factor (ECF subfamily)
MKQTRLSQDQQTQAAATQTDEWVVQARAGDQTAFHRLVDRFQPEIFRMIYYRTRSQADAEDLTQDVFLKAFRSLKRLENTAVFRSWLYRIAVNRVNDHFRKKRLKALIGFSSMDEDDFVETEEMAVAPQATREMARKEFWTRVKGAMKALSKMEREVFMLRFFDQLPIKEITAALKKNESTVKTHLYRAMNKVKDDLADMEGLLEGL